MIATDRPLRVLVLGAGLMGTQIGCEYALAGHEVVLVARHARPVRDRVHRALAMVEAYQLRAPSLIDKVRRTVIVATSLNEVTSDIDLVVESLPEDLDTKTRLLRHVIDRKPGAAIATNTSSLSVTTLGEEVGATERTVGTHYWNPPLLMPLVELVAGSGTSQELLDEVEHVLRGLGKRPVRVGDVPGFVWNRLQLALLREAIWVVEQGVATPEIVDEIVRDGLARRWRLTGPFETVALGGPATFERIAENLFPLLSQAVHARRLAAWALSDQVAMDAVRTRRDAGLAEDLRVTTDTGE